MKPKYKQTLLQLINYYYPECNDYQVRIYINGRLEYEGFMQTVGSFGNEYLSVVEFYRNPSTKTITIYTSEQ